MPHVAAHLALGLGHVPRGGGGQLLAPRLGGVLRVGAAAVSVGLDTAAHREESSSIVTSIYTTREGALIYAVTIMAKSLWSF